LSATFFRNVALRTKSLPTPDLGSVLLEVATAMQGYPCARKPERLCKVKCYC